MKLFQIVKFALVIILSSSGIALAADMGGSVKDGGWHSPRTCFLMRRSPILDLPSTSAMRSEVEKRYDHSVAVSERQHVIASRRAVFPWAVEAKAACGQAIGYFKGREINDEAISKCDCFYGRMLSHYRRY